VGRTIDTEEHREALTLAGSIALVGQRAFDIGPSLYQCLEDRSRVTQHLPKLDRKWAVRNCTLLVLNELVQLNALAHGESVADDIHLFVRLEPTLLIGNEVIDPEFFFDTLVIIVANSLGEAFNDHLHLEWRLLIDSRLFATR